MPHARTRPASPPLLALPGAATLLATVLAAAPVAGAQVRRPLPSVLRIEPTSGPPGTVVTLVGRHFDDGQVFLLGEVELEAVEVTPARARLRIPAEARTGPIRIRAERGTVTARSFRVTQAAPAPVITGLEPDEGSPGDEVRIHGANFGTRPADHVVHLGERPVVVRAANPATLTVLVPEGARTGAFRVEVAGAAEHAESEPFTIESGLAIAAVHPTFGPVGTRVTIEGTGFDRRRARNRVYLGSRRMTVRRASPTELVVTVPLRAETDHLRVAVGEDEVYTERPFRVGDAPAVTEVTPPAAAVGVQVAVRGQGFGSDRDAVTVRVGDRPLDVQRVGDREVVARVPDGASSGDLVVEVEGYPAVTVGPFPIVPSARITGFAPTSGGAGTEVRITGEGFSPEPSANRVTIGGQVAEVLGATETELRVRVPVGRSGPIVVRIPRSGEARTARPFQVLPVPEIASIEPEEVAPGGALTVRGRNFGSRSGLIRAYLGERELALEAASDTMLRLRLPADAESGRLRVTVRLRGSVVTDEEVEVRAED